MSKTKDGDFFVETCSPDVCDGSHVVVKIGFEGKAAIARHVTDAAGAREIAAMFCAVAEHIERRGLAPKPQ